MSEKDERKKAAASYIITFYECVLDLTNHFSNYSNLLIEAKFKFKDLDKVGEMEKNILIQTAQLVRFNSHKCFIMYKTLLQPLKLKENKQIEKDYLALKDQFIIEEETLKNFTIGLNSVLVADVIKELLDLSNELIDNIYKNE